jgi:hypothetical protein
MAYVTPVTASVVITKEEQHLAGKLLILSVRIRSEERTIANGLMIRHHQVLYHSVVVA